MSRPPAEPVVPTEGQESVWDYPRPPRVEASDAVVRIQFGGGFIADSTRAVRVLETSHPPVFYVPRDDFAPGVLRSAAGGSFCEFKGTASYLTIVGADGRRAPSAAWFYAEPAQGYEALRGRVAVYPAAMDACSVDGETVQPQQGDFYGGWITCSVVGPFKGAPGTLGW
jgi:uncharacterized protein (DUF427 family)